MKKLTVVVCCLIIGALGLVMTGCGDPTDKYVGTWKVTNVSTNGGTVWMTAEVYGLQDSGITFNKDGKCEIDISDNVNTGTWEINDDQEIIITITDANSEIHLTDEDGILQTIGSDTVMQFEKE